MRPTIRRFVLAMLPILLLMAIASLWSCASLTRGDLLRANVRHDMPIKPYRPRIAWRAADETVGFHAQFEGWFGCPTWALWVWNIYEPAEVVALDECGRDVVAVHPFRRGQPYEVHVFFMGAKPTSVRQAIDHHMGNDLMKGRP